MLQLPIIFIRLHIHFSLNINPLIPYSSQTDRYSACLELGLEERGFFGLCKFLFMHVLGCFRSRSIKTLTFLVNQLKQIILYKVNLIVSYSKKYGRMVT